MIMLNDIQKRLREAIETSSLSKKELAERLNINPSTISRYLHDDKFPSIETFANLCEVLDVSADDILGLKWHIKYKKPPRVKSFLHSGRLLAFMRLCYLIVAIQSSIADSGVTRTSSLNFRFNPLYTVAPWHALVKSLKVCPIHPPFVANG